MSYNRVIMFSLCYGFLDSLFRKDEHRILVVGLDGAGKTTFLERLKSLYTSHEGLDPEKIRPTVGLNVARFEAHNANLIFWDLGGAANLRSLWEKYYVETHGVMFVVDSVERERFDEAKSALDKVLASRDLIGCPLLVWCNKSDAPCSKGTDEVMECLGLAKMHHQRQSKAIAGSALNGSGIHEGVEWLVQTIKTSQRHAVLRDRVT